MHFLYSFFNIVILLGAVQGFIISSLLFFTKRNLTANRLLAFLIFFIALACLNLSLSNLNLFPSGTFFSIISAIVPMVIVMPLGPLLYFYIKASLNTDFKLAKKDRIHFCTVIIDLVPYLTAIFFIIGVLTGIIKNHHSGIGFFIDTYNTYADIPRWLSLTIYLVLSIRYISAYQKQGNVHRMNYHLKWVRQLTGVFTAFQFVWLLYLIPYVIPAYSDKLYDWVNWYPIYVPMSVLIYWLGINGYLLMQHQPLTVKKAGSSLPTNVLDETVFALTGAMEQDMLYLNPDLNLNTLAQHTGIPQKTISAALNQYLHKSFNEFVNEYRVNAFKEKLCSDDIKLLTIAGIAYECGFNSQATFQRTFRQITGLSPSEFKMQAQNH